MVPKIKPSRPLTQSQVVLRMMVQQLTEDCLPVASQHQNIIVNNIPADLKITADQHQLAVMIGRLMNTALGYVRNSSLHISAKFYSNVMLIHFKGDVCLSDPAFEEQLKDIHEMAQAAGGMAGVTSYRNEITTVALSVRNAKIAA